MTAHAHFLQRMPLPKARALLLAGVRPVEGEEICVDDAGGRVTAMEVVARHAAPHYRASAMDGVAVRAADTAGAPLVLPVAAGAEATAPATPACLPVDTGARLPDWADAVVRIEEARATDGGYAIPAPVPPGRDVRREGEDIEAGSVLAPAGQRLRPADLGAILATGIHRIIVRRRPRVAILATGGEVVEPGSAARPGEVIESNSRVIAALVAEWGGSAHRLGICRDDDAALARAVADAAARFDVVCVLAGSSAGRRDRTVPVLASLGEVFVRGVDIAPGRPVALARLATDGRTTPVLATPGYPVSAIVACERLLRPLVAALLGTSEGLPPSTAGRLARPLASRVGMEEFRRVCLTRQDDGSHVVATLPSGAGSISTVTGAHGWLRIEATAEGLDAGTVVEVELMVPREEVDAALVLAGFPGAASAALERRLRETDRRARVHHLRLAAHDAPAAVRRGEAHAVLLAAGESHPGEGAGLVAVEVGGSDGATAACLAGSSTAARLAGADRRETA